MKHVLVTGANGFIGKNLLLVLGRESGIETTTIDIDTPDHELQRGLDICDVVVHLAGVNRPLKDEEFRTGNVESLATILSGLESRQRMPLILLSSSAQVLIDNAYGRSKLCAEELLSAYCSRTGSSACVFRLPGVFGKWSRPNYNSVVATFCHNIARNIPIKISDPLREIELVHVDDVVSAFFKAMSKRHKGVAYCNVSPVFKIILGQLAKKLYEFQNERETLDIPDLKRPFLRKLFGTYISYLPPNNFSYELERKTDSRGALAEILKANGHGQIFVSRTKPGIVRGGHYHDTKVEKFLVLTGEALIKFRNIATDEKAEYFILGKEFKIVDIPPGWTHSIKNVGNTEMIVLFWASEVFDPDCPDTYPAEV